MLAHICRRSLRHAIKETEYLSESYVNNYNTRLTDDDVHVLTGDTVIDII